MKKLIRKFLMSYGYDIHKIHNCGKLSTHESKSDLEGLSYHTTPIGNYYLPRNVWGEDGISYHMKRGLYYGSDVIKMAKKLVKKGSIVLDLGANFGQMTLAFSDMVGDGGAVYCFEAQKSVFQILNSNIKANNKQNIKPFYNAVYDKNDEVLFFPEVDYSLHHSLGSFSLDPKSQNGEKINTITIDSIEFDRPISFMKVDIQGSDLFALKGAEQTILKHKMPIVFEFEQQFQEKFQTSFQDYVDFINKIGYKFSEVSQTPDEVNFLIIPK